MARAVLIANPAAARTRTKRVLEIERMMTAAGWHVDVVHTGGPGDGRPLAQAAVDDGAELVAVFGGDGTVMQAAAALAGTEIPLGIIPGGTGNLLAGNLRLPGNPLRAVEVMLRGVPRPIDLGLVERPLGRQCFAVACGAGIDARVMAETPAEQKRKWGMMAYVATTLRLLQEVALVPFVVSVDGEQQEFEAAMILVANCGEMIPRLIRISADVTPYDGLLDVVVVKAESVTGGFRAVWDLVRATPGTYGKDVSVARARGRVITVSSNGDVQPVQMDGEPGGATPFTATVAPGAIRVMVPAR